MFSEISIFNSEVKFLCHDLIQLLVSSPRSLYNPILKHYFLYFQVADWLFSSFTTLEKTVWCNQSTFQNTLKETGSMYEKVVIEDRIVNRVKRCV